MNRLEHDIRAALIDVRPLEGGEWAARFVFPPDFVGFQGHFPDKPVLPGVCLIQATLLALSGAAPVPPRLTRIASAKWFAPVQPGAELTFVLRETPADHGRAVVKSRITCDGQRVAELTLDVLRGSTGKESA